MKRFPAPALVSLLAAVLWFAPSVPAQDNAMKPATPATVIHFSKIDAIDLAVVLPDPPAAGSLAANADLETVLQVQAARTPEQVAWAQIVERYDLFESFGAFGLFGPEFKKENFPLLLALIKDVNDDLRPMVDASKKRYARARPYAVDPRVKPCVALPTNDSYPSGHAYTAYMRAAVLSEVFPDKRAALFDRARYFAWGRILGGVHFPTDLDGGRRLAEAGFAEVKKSAAFRAAVEKCQKEAAAAVMKKAA
jgi:acid phosphatase (class A)